MKTINHFTKSLILIVMLSSENLFAQQTEYIKIQNGEVILNTTIYPKENAETVILLHGGPGVPDPMTEVALELNNKFQVITFEQRGTGQSWNPNSEYAMTDYISDIDSIASHFNLESFHLFGHSWGGLYAQIYAEERPENIESLFLCSPSSGTNSTWKKTEKEVMKYNKMNASWGEWMKMGWNSLLGMLGSDRAYQKVFFLVMKNYHKNYSDISINKEQLRTITADPVNITRKNIVSYKRLEPMTQPNFPILVTYGDGDIYGESKNEVYERYPKAEFHVIEDCGHIGWIHNPEKFGEILGTFYSIDTRDIVSSTSIKKP
ncbi:MAG: alpha/beta hydrolase [Cyclobacteriaceae bacterium]|nr:alpha/beta hydrolase [Cyclobacteriaceae bacterium SS2]